MGGSISLAVGLLGLAVGFASCGGNNATVNIPSSSYVRCVSWSKVDDYNAVSSQDAEGHRLIIDKKGNLLAGGVAKDSNGKKLWAIRKSADGGTTWTVAASDSGTEDTLWGALAEDSSGVLYMTLERGPSGGTSVWKTYKSADGGATWTALHSYQLNASFSSRGRGFVASSSGSLYAAGDGGESATVDRWIVQKSTDGGASWTVVDNAYLASGFDVALVGLKLVTAGLFAFGDMTDSSSKRHWVVRSTADGTTWTSVDDFNLTGGGNAQASGMASDASGNLFVAGSALDSGGKSHAVVRKSSDSGKTWSTVLDYQMTTGQDTTGNVILVDGGGNVYIAGGASDGTAKHWYVRRSTDAGAAWAEVDKFQLESGKDSEARGMVTDSTGKIWVVGEAKDSSSVKHWAVRKCK